MWRSDDGSAQIFGSFDSEPADDVQIATEIDESMDPLFEKREISMGRSSNFSCGPPTLPPSPSFFAAVAWKLLALDRDEQQLQQQQYHQKQQQKLRERQGRQQWVYLCSRINRINCGEQFERPNTLQRHIVSILDYKGVLCPFCVSKEKKIEP